MGLRPSFSTPNFLSGDSGKGFYFMIASDHKLILRFFWWSEKMKLWSEGIIKVKHFSGAPDKKLAVENDGLEPTKLFTRRKLENHFFHSWIFAKPFERFLIFSLFHTCEHFEKWSSDLWKKCVMKFQKWKIWDVHFFHFSVPVVMVYDFFQIFKHVW